MKSPFSPFQTSQNWAEVKSRLSAPPLSAQPEQRHPHLWNPTVTAAAGTTVTSSPSSPPPASSTLPPSTSSSSLPLSTSSTAAASTSFATPLVHPRRVHSLTDVFQRLDVVKTFEGGDDDDETVGSGEQRRGGKDGGRRVHGDHGVEEKRETRSDFHVVYHLYLANKSYSKSTCGAPAYRVFMRKAPASSSSTSSSSLPSAADLQRLFSSFRDGAPLLFASLSAGDDPSFFAFYDITLPPAPVHIDSV